MSTVSPSMRPLTKSVPSESARVPRQPVKPSKMIASNIQVLFIRSSPCLLAISTLGAADRTREIGAGESQRVHGSYARIIGFRQPVLRIDDLGIVCDALKK